MSKKRKLDSFTDSNADSLNPSAKRQCIRKSSNCQSDQETNDNTNNESNANIHRLHPSLCSINDNNNNGNNHLSLSQSEQEVALLLANLKNTFPGANSPSLCSINDNNNNGRNNNNIVSLSSSSLNHHPQIHSINNNNNNGNNPQRIVRQFASNLLSNSDDPVLRQFGSSLLLHGTADNNNNIAQQVINQAVSNNPQLRQIVTHQQPRMKSEPSIVDTNNHNNGSQKEITNQTEATYSYLFDIIAFMQIPIPNIDQLCKSIKQGMNHNKSVDECEKYRELLCLLFEVNDTEIENIKCQIEYLYGAFKAIEKDTHLLLENQVKNEIKILISTHWTNIIDTEFVVDIDWIILVLKRYKIGYLNRIIPEILRCYEQSQYGQLTTTGISFGVIIFLSHQVNIQYLQQHNKSFDLLVKDVFLCFFRHFRGCSHSIKQIFLHKVHSNNNTPLYPSLEFILKYVQKDLSINIDFDDHIKKYKNRDDIVKILIQQHLFGFASKIFQSPTSFREILVRITQHQSQHQLPNLPSVIDNNNDIKSEQDNNNCIIKMEENNNNNINDTKYRYSMINEEITMNAGLNLDKFMNDGVAFTVAEQSEPQCYVNCTIPIQPGSCPTTIIIAFNCHQTSSPVSFYKLKSIATDVQFGSLYSAIKEFYTDPNASPNLYSLALEPKKMYIYYDSNDKDQCQELPLQLTICDVLYNGHKNGINKCKFTQETTRNGKDELHMVEKCLFIDVTYQKRKKKKKKKMTKREEQNKHNGSFIDLTND